MSFGNGAFVINLIHECFAWYQNKAAHIYNIDLGYWVFMRSKEQTSQQTLSQNQWKSSWFVSSVTYYWCTMEFGGTATFTFCALTFNIVTARIMMNTTNFGDSLSLPLNSVAALLWISL